jgi:inorganic pyrophosphatase
MKNHTASYFHPSCFSYNINWNYGLLPQTWEDPSFPNPDVDGALGDNDPGILQLLWFLYDLKTFQTDCNSFNGVFLVDVVEIGERQAKIGQILKVKPLAALAMIDEGELDWKIITISLDDPRASLVNDIDDVEKHFSVNLVILVLHMTVA